MPRPSRHYKSPLRGTVSAPLRFSTTPQLKLTIYNPSHRKLHPEFQQTSGSRLSCARFSQLHSSCNLKRIRETTRPPEMTKPTEISVVVTNYNYSQYIIKCLDSILIQTHKPKELVIVDDCSTDGSFDLLKRYIQQHNTEAEGSVP